MHLMGFRSTRPLSWSQSHALHLKTSSKVANLVTVGSRSYLSRQIFRPPDATKSLFLPFLLQWSLLALLAWCFWGSAVQLDLCLHLLKVVHSTFWPTLRWLKRCQNLSTAETYGHNLKSPPVVVTVPQGSLVHRRLLSLRSSRYVYLSGFRR